LRDRAILEILYAGGLRVSEVTALSTGDLALDAGRVQVRGKATRNALCRWGVLRWSLWRLICAKAVLTWRVSVRRAGPMRPGRMLLGSFSHCAHAIDAAMGLALGKGGQLRSQSAPAAPQLRYSHGGARRDLRSVQILSATPISPPRGLHALGPGPVEGVLRKHHPRATRRGSEVEARPKPRGGLRIVRVPSRALFRLEETV